MTKVMATAMMDRITLERQIALNALLQFNNGADGQRLRDEVRRSEEAMEAQMRIYEASLPADASETQRAWLP
ncbi:MAG: hypothetical protein LIP23_03330, partial [Planctomycetes bacterium]|nr:hypothetical protein [Planctomycetota bacterium]